MASSLILTFNHVMILALYFFTLYATFVMLDIPFIQRKKDDDFYVGQLQFLTIWNLKLDRGVMRENFLTVFHAAAFVQFAFSVYYDFTHTHVPADIGKIHNAYGGKFKFLTFWDAIVQTLFFVTCLLNDIFGTNSINPKNKPFIRKFKDYFHASVGFPVAMFVGLTFWALMFVDRELVLPKALDPYFPAWLNHLMHTMIMIATLLEMLLAPRKYPKRSKGIGIFVGFMLIYLTWMHFVHYMSGVWAYPIIEILSWPLRVVFYLLLLVFGTGLYYLGESLDRLIWGTTESVDKSSKKKKHK